MYDFDKLEEVTNLVIQGTTYEELKSVLSLPERLLFYPAARSDGVGVNDMSVIVTFDKVEITDPEIGLNWAHLDLDWPGEEARDIATVKLRVPSTLHNLDEIKIYTLNRFKELLQEVSSANFFYKVEITDVEEGFNWAILNLGWPDEELGAEGFATFHLRVPRTLRNLDEIKIHTLNRWKELLQEVPSAEYFY